MQQLDKTPTNEENIFTKDEIRQNSRKKSTVFTGLSAVFGAALYGQTAVLVSSVSRTRTSFQTFAVLPCSL